MAGKKPAYNVFVSRQIGDGTNGKTFYDQVGVAWDIKDGGVSVQLHALPIDGRLVLFVRKDDG